MALTIQLCVGVGGTPHKADVDSFEKFADSLRDVETVQDKRAALTIMPVELVDGPSLNADAEIEKTASNVARVTVLAWDFDDVTEAQMLLLFKELLGLRWAAHTTFSHPEALKLGLQRWRVWVELSAPVPADKWVKTRELFDSVLPLPVDQQTRNPNRLMFGPCARPGEEHLFEVFDWREFPGAVSATPLEPPSDPASLPSAITAREAGSEGGFEPASLDDLRKLRDKLRRRAGKFENLMGDYVAALIRGVAFVKEKSHEPTMDLARTLADELPDAAAWSLAALAAPSLAVMRLEFGSDETEKGFAEKIVSWRKRRSAERARFALPRSMMGLPSGEATQSGNEIAFAPDAETALDARFAIFEHPNGTQITYETLPGGVCVRQATDARLIETVVRAVPFEDGGARTTARKAQNRVADWRPVSRRLLEEPEPSRFLGDPGFCIQRLPFDLSPGPTPAWDEFTGRLSDARLFKAFVWTGFEKKNRGRQVLWVKGDGEDGKSTAMTVLREALGAAATAASAAMFSSGSRFGLSALDGKRFAIVFDCKDTRLLMNEQLRNVTSGDEVIVEYKGQALETKRLNVKLVVCSNYLPDLTGSRADVSRLILLTVEKSLNRDDPSWEGRLREELPAFLASCKEAYEELCPHHGKLPLDEAARAAINERADSFEEEFADTLAEFMVVTGDRADEIPCGPIFRALTGRGMTSRGWPQGKYEEFKRYLFRLGVTSHRVTAGRVFVGARAKTRGEVKSFDGGKK